MIPRHASAPVDSLVVTSPCDCSPILHPLRSEVTHVEPVTMKMLERITEMAAAARGALFSCRCLGCGQNQVGHA